MRTVNFIEAIRSGKRFKPVSQDDHGWMYVQYDENNEYQYVMHNGYKQYIAVDLALDQFELEENKIVDLEQKLKQETLRREEAEKLLIGYNKMVKKDYRGAAISGTTIDDHFRKYKDEK